MADSKNTSPVKGKSTSTNYIDCRYSEDNGSGGAGSAKKAKLTQINMSNSEATSDIKMPI